MDYSEFDALPSKTDEISISEEPSHDGIRGLFRILPTGNETIPCPAAVLQRMPNIMHSLA